MMVAGAAGVAQSASAPSKTNVVAKVTFEAKINRYVKDNLRWAKDVYTIKSGGTLRVTNNAADEGPHTFTVVKAKDLPKTVKQLFECKVCETLGKAHGADPESDAPPTHLFLENGVGQDQPPAVDRAGDSAFVDGKKGAHVDLKITAKKGTTLSFLCLIHPWMQAKVLVK
jgi:hypothetical protein